jgi:hypothetical protein
LNSISLFFQKHCYRLFRSRFVWAIHLALFGLVFSKTLSSSDQNRYLELYASGIALFCSSGVISHETASHNLEVNYTRAMSLRKLFISETLSGLLLCMTLDCIFASAVLKSAMFGAAGIKMLVACLAFSAVYYSLSIFFCAFMRGYSAPAIAFAIVLAADLSLTSLAREAPTLAKSFSWILPVQVPKLIGLVEQPMQMLILTAQIGVFSLVCFCLASTIFSAAWRQTA